MPVAFFFPDRYQLLLHLLPENQYDELIHLLKRSGNLIQIIEITNLQRKEQWAPSIYTVFPGIHTMFDKHRSYPAHILLSRTGGGKDVHTSYSNVHLQNLQWHGLPV